MPKKEKLKLSCCLQELCTSIANQFVILKLGFKNCEVSKKLALLFMGNPTVALNRVLFNACHLRTSRLTVSKAGTGLKIINGTTFYKKS